MSPALALVASLVSGSSPSPDAASPSEVAGSIVLSGVMRTAGNRTPIAGARVMIVPAPADMAVGPVEPSQHLDPATDPVAWVRTTETDEAGRFLVGDLKASRVRVVVVAADHVRREQIVEVADLPRRGLSLFVESVEDSAYRTVVETPPEPPAEHVKSTILEAEEVRTAPGSQGDPLRALLNLPGVARSPGGLGVLVLRGAAPNQSRVFLGGHGLPRAFHALAYASVVPASAIERMEFVPGNFDARFGDATGGVVLLHPADVQRRGVHGFGRLDFLGAGAVASGPLKKGAFLVAAQRGWVDAVLGVVERVDPTANFLMPRYYDYQAFFEYPVGERGEVVARVLGAGDRLQSRIADPEGGPRPVTVFEVVSQFQRVDLSYRVRHGAWSLWLTPSFRFERNGSRHPLGATHSIRDDYVFSLRTEASRRLSKRVELLVGADLEIDRYTADHERPFILSTQSEAVDIDERGLQTGVGAYARAAIRLRKWLVSPGVRVSGFSLGDTTRAALDPRINAHWSFAPRWRWSMGAGLYSQARVQQSTVSGDYVQGTASQVRGNVVLPASILSLEPRSGFLPVDGGLEVARAAQVSTALSREFAGLWFAEVGAWARARDNANGLYRPPDEPARAVTSTWSSAYGLEFMLRRKLGPKLWGWVGYTLSRADVHVLSRIGSSDVRDSRPTDFDQRHNLVVLASYRLPRRWRLGGRFRLVSGSPFTDVVGPVWTGAGNPVPRHGYRNTARFPVFHQLDVRVDKSWLLQRVEVGAYLDVQNVYNKINPEAFIYNTDYSRRIDAVGMPIFPSLGVRVDY